MAEQDSAMPDTVHERMGKAEQEIHTLKYQMSELKQWPPRVTDLERVVGNLDTKMEHMSASLNEQGDEMRHGFQTMSLELQTGFRELRAESNASRGEKAGFSRAIKWATGLAAIVTAVVVAVLWLNENAPSLVTTAEVVGMAAQCKDGSYSTSTSRGACSGHGGVERWISD